MLKGWAPLPLEVGAVEGMASLGDPACSSALGDPVPGAVGRLSPVVRTLREKKLTLKSEVKSACVKGIVARRLA